MAFTLLGIISFFTFLGLYLAFRSPTEELPASPLSSTPAMTSEFKLSSPSFSDNGRIPSDFTCDGKNISPELHVENVPEGTQSLVLVMDDPDIPEEVKSRLGIEKFDHWTLYNLPPDTSVIPEGARIGTLGLTSRGEPKYTGPCPPDREHRYFFRLYALSGTLSFIKAPTQREVEEAAKGMLIDTTTLMGRYERITTPQ